MSVLRIVLVLFPTLALDISLVNIGKGFSFIKGLSKKPEFVYDFLRALRTKAGESSFKILGDY